MLTAEIKINGCLIGHLYIHNEGYRFSSEKLSTICNYYIEYYETGKDIKTGYVQHDRVDGAAVLIEKAMKMINKKLGGKSNVRKSENTKKNRE